MDVDEKVERLKKPARGRWGERWAVRVLHFTDDNYQAFAFQSQGRIEVGHLEVDRLFRLC